MADDSMADDSVAGDSMADDSMADDSVAGDSMGDSVADDSMADDSVAGDSMAGDVHAPFWWPGRPDQFPSFLAVLGLVLDALHGVVAVDTAGGRAVVPTPAGDARLRLAPLADICTGLPPEEWAGALHRELVELDAACLHVAATSVADLDGVLPFLRLRLVEAGRGATTVSDVQPFSAPFAGDLGAELVVELPAVRWALPRAVVRRWPVDTAELLREVAERSVRRTWQPPPSIDTAGSTVLTSSAAYVSALLYAPSVLLAPVTSTWLLAAPTAHTVIVHAGRPGDDHAVDVLVDVVSDLHRAGPHPLSTRLFRWVGHQRVEVVDR